jgi:hypothetical protein
MDSIEVVEASGIDSGSAELKYGSSQYGRSVSNARTASRAFTTFRPCMPVWSYRSQHRRCSHSHCLHTVPVIPLTHTVIDTTAHHTVTPYMWHRFIQYATGASFTFFFAIRVRQSY